MANRRDDAFRNADTQSKCIRHDINTTSYWWRFFLYRDNPRAASFNLNDAEIALSVTRSDLSIKNG